MFLRQPEAERPAARSRPGGRQQHPRDAHRRRAPRLWAHCAAYSPAVRALLLQGRFQLRGARALRAAPQERGDRPVGRRHDPSGPCHVERRDGGCGPAVRPAAGARRHDLPGDRTRRSHPARQRPGHRRHLRPGRAQLDHGGPERDDRHRDRCQALALHRGGPRRTLERRLDRVASQRRDVPLGELERQGTGDGEVSDPVRVAVIGAGAIAQVAHLPVLRRLPGVEVCAICDSDIGKAQALAGRFDVKETFDDIEEVLKYARPTAVAICTPNHLHEIHVVSALAAGAHVLCERPLALTVAGVERVLQASEKYGRRVMVGMNHRFRSDVQAVRGFLAGGDIGVLQAIRCGWYTFQPSRNLVAWRLRRQEAGGGAFLDLGLQLLDLGLWLAAWPAAKRIAAHTMGQGKDSVEDMATALIVCENGVSLSIDVSWRHMGDAERFWFDLVGTKGSARVQPLRVFKEMHGSITDVTPTGASGRETPFAQSYRAEWTYFLAVMRGDVNAPPPRDQLALHRVLDAIYRSADEGRDVLL
ncbi:MAG: hypothetical protein DMD42_06130 [Gemmatimonadetes bacterium]|nr:MAG: hypothetical protein DMD42_06130 [Gemmatimonadota bacterium]